MLKGKKKKKIGQLKTQNTNIQRNLQETHRGVNRVTGFSQEELNNRTKISDAKVMDFHTK